MENNDTWRLALEAINMLATLAIGCWMYLERRNDKTNERVSALAAKVDQMDKDVASLQTTSEKAPNHADLAKVYESINALAATVNQLVGENRGQSDTLRLILSRITEKGMA